MVENGNTRPTGVQNVEQRIDNGRVYTVREIDDTGIGDGGTFSVVMQNPADSKTFLLAVAPNITTTGEAFIEKIENPTIDTSGDTITPRNKHIGFDRTANATAQAGGTNFTGSYSGGTSRGKEVIGGQSAKQPGAVGVIDLSLRLNPGESVQYKVESNSSSNIVSTVITFFEEKGTDI